MSRARSLLRTSLVLLALSSLIAAGSQSPSVGEDARWAGHYHDPDGGSRIVSWSASGGLTAFSTEPLGQAAVEVTEEGLLVEGRLLEAVDGPYGLREVAFESAGATLVGTVLLPWTTEPLGAVVMIHGSGDSDRDNPWYFAIADALARSGLAVLLPDKRGSGESGGDRQEVGYEGFAADARAGADRLRELVAVAPTKVGYLGVSQGGHVAPLAADGDPRAAFAVNLSGSAVTLGETVLHEVAVNWRSAGAGPAMVEMGLELERRAQAYMRDPAAWDAYLEYYRKLDEDFSGAATASYPDDPDDPHWHWWRRVVDVDPLPIWERLTVPALTVYGEEDENDNVPVAESVRRLETLRSAPPHTVKVYADTGHGLRTEDRSRVRPDVLQELADWIHAALRGGDSDP